MMLHPSRPADYLIETALLLWLFAGIRPLRRPSVRQRVDAALPILFLALLYIPMFPSDRMLTNLLQMMLRFVCRGACCTVYLRTLKGIRWGRAAYFACLYAVLYHSYLNIISAPALYSIFNTGAVALVPNRVLNAILGEIITHGVEFLLLWVVRRFTRLDEMENIGSGRVAMLAAASACVIYAKASTSFIRGSSTGFMGEISAIMILMHLVLVAMIVYYERYLELRRNREAERLQELSNAYVIRSMDTWRTGQENIRALAHDMRNHLLAIRQLAAAGESDKVGAYVDAMLSELSLEAQGVETGSDLLNGLISEKAAEASKDGVELSVVLDSDLVSFVSNADLCTLFGNTLDNAIEACRKVPDPALRYIALRGVGAAGQAVVTVSNSCVGTVCPGTGGLPETTKEQGERHGLGLKNVRRVLEKYGGLLTINTETEGKFSLTMLLPIPAETQKEAAGIGAGKPTGSPAE